MQKNEPTSDHPVRLVSAGGVVYKRVDGKTEVVLCGRLSPEQWRLPKGTPDPGETLEQTALREVQEETGLEVRLLCPITDINYTFYRPNDGARCLKTVYFYLVEPIGGSEDQHDPEFDIVRWFPIEDAPERLFFKTESEVVEQAATLIDGGHHGG